MVAAHQGFQRLGHAVELQQAAAAAVRLGLEELHRLGRRDVLLHEHLPHGRVRDLGRRVEEVENLGGGLDAVLGSLLRVDKAVVLVAHVVLEGRALVRQVKGRLAVRQILLLGVAELHLVAEEVDVVEVADGSLHGQSVAHLHHGTPVLGLQELHLNHVAIEAEHVEEAVCIEAVLVEAIHH